MYAPKYRLEAIETIGRKILLEYDCTLLEGPPQAIPIETIIETKFNLTLEYHTLRKNGSVLGETIFDDGAAILYDRTERQYRLIAVKAGTILIDERLCTDRLLGRMRFTCAHELGHWVLHQKLYSGTGDVAAYHRVKLILKIYRDVVWVLSERAEELHEYAWELGNRDADAGLCYLENFAPDIDLQEFEEKVCCVMESRMLVDVIDRALLRLKRYPDRGELYYEILTKQFIHRFNSTEKELLDELNMERSVFYDRKREALFLFSVCLFGYAVPELQEELDAPRLFPD